MANHGVQMRSFGVAARRRRQEASRRNIGGIEIFSKWLQNAVLWF